MEFCIRCNPVSMLVKDENGDLICRYHEKNYLLEHHDDLSVVIEFPPIEPPAVEVVPLDVPPEPPVDVPPVVQDVPSEPLL